jgi:holo-[acyl-carrier protein] synthase
MISGIGIDMIEVDRVAVKIGKENGFRELVFSQEEIEYCESRANKFEHYAVRFAAKEALFKALGTGWKNGTSFFEIVVTHDENGKPGISLKGETAETLAAARIRQILVSLSHLKATAVAVVIVET